MTTIHCPICQVSGEGDAAGRVEIDGWDFSATSIEVPACQVCARATGIVSVTMRISAVQRFAVAEEQMVVEGGFVRFGG